MRTSYENWGVRGYQRERRDEDGSLVGYETVVAITAPGEWLWELVVDDSRLVDLRARALGQHPVDTRHIPTGNLVRIATAYLERVAENIADGSNVMWSMLLSDLQPGQPRRNLDGSPTSEEFARAWVEMGPRTLDGRTRRVALADAFGVTTHAIDKWAGQARDRGLIPPARTGRPRKRTEN